MDSGSRELLQGSLEKYERLNPYKQKGEKVPPLAPDVQERVINRIANSEQRINKLAGEAIVPERRDLAGTIGFLPTPDFFEEVSENANVDFTGENFYRVVQLLQETFDTQGLRSMDGKRISVHTTKYTPGQDPVQLTEAEAYEVGMHELTHGKVELRITTPTPGKTIRQTGTKVITFEEGKEPKGRSVLLYEAQTDALWTIAAHPEVKTWDDVVQIFKRRQFGEDNIATDGLEALAIVIDCAFPNFEEGVKFLTTSYYSCEDVLLPLWDRLDEMSHSTATPMTYFSVANNKEDASGMLKAAQNLRQEYQRLNS